MKDLLIEILKDLGIACFILCITELIAFCRRKNEKKTKEVEKIDQCLLNTDMIPIILEGMYLKEENNVPLREKLNSIKYSVEELGKVLINNCGVDFLVNI